jgi:O-antigen/teichoic acid export membrane protein
MPTVTEDRAAQSIEGSETRLPPWSRWVGKGAVTLLDQAIVSGSSFFVSILLARMLRVAEYGAYALAISVFLFTSSFQNALVLEPMGVLGSSLYRSKLRPYLVAVTRINVALCTGISVLLTVVVLLYRFSTHNTVVSSALLGVSLVYAIPVLIFWLWRRAAYLQFRPGIAIRGSCVYAAIIFPSLYCFKHNNWLSPSSAFLVQGVAAAIASLVLFRSVMPACQAGGSTLSTSAVFECHWTYGKWVAATAVGYWLTTGAYYVFVGLFLPLERVAELRVLQNLSMPVNQFLTAQTNLLLPVAAVQFADHGPAALRKITKLLTAVFTMAGLAYLLILVLFGRRLMSLFYPASYVHLAYLLPLSALPVVLIAAAQGTVIGLWARRLPREVFWGYSASGVVSLPLGILLTRYAGLIGALIALSSSAAVFLVVVLYRNRKINTTVADFSQVGDRVDELASRENAEANISVA